MARVVLPQSKVRARRKRQRIIILSLLAAAVVLLFVGVVWLAHASFMRVSTVEVSGETTLNPASISSLVLSDLNGSYLYLFPRDNIFLYPKYKTQSDLLAQMPTIAKVTINAKDFHTLNVVVTERARKALWCGTGVAAAGACFWLDQDGVAYAATSDLDLSLDAASSTYEHYYGALQGSDPQQYLTVDQFHSLSALIDALAQNQPGNAIVSVEVDTSNDVRVTFANNFVLLFNLTSAGADVYQRFQLALSSNAFAGHTLNDFEYLDLRFGDKLYYKLRNGVAASSTSATSN
jgi:cell division septal protein FtsQ